jgi:hypothetical protein
MKSFFLKNLIISKDTSKTSFTLNRYKKSLAIWGHFTFPPNSSPPCPSQLDSTIPTFKFPKHFETLDRSRHRPPRT